MYRNKQVLKYCVLKAGRIVQQKLETNITKNKIWIGYLDKCSSSNHFLKTAVQHKKIYNFSVYPDEIGA